MSTTNIGTRSIARIAIVLGLALAQLAAAERASAQQYFQPLPDEYYRGKRVRFGVHGELGGTAGVEGGLGGGLGLQIGFQINDVVATYAQHRMFFADSMDAARDGIFATSFNSLLLELTVFQTIQIGAGPSIDAGIDALCPRQGQPCSGLQGPFVGLETRVALVIGDRSFARRRGLVISAHVHPTWIDAATVVTTVSLAVGFQIY